MLAYAAMAVAQTWGGVIIYVLHGSEAAERAQSRLVGMQGVTPSWDIPDLCQSYEASHFDRASNILHASSMVATLWLLVYSVTLFFFGFFKPKNFLNILPLYYLPAWFGHFVFQKDIPAVLAYGTTVHGILVGEYCAFLALLTGGMTRDVNDIIFSGILLVGWIAFLFSFGNIWPAPPSLAVKVKSS